MENIAKTRNTVMLGLLAGSLLLGACTTQVPPMTNAQRQNYDNCMQGYQGMRLVSGILTLGLSEVSTPALQNNCATLALLSDKEKTEGNQPSGAAMATDQALPEAAAK